MKLDVLFEDNHLLVICKPAGVLSQPDAAGRSSVIDLARRRRQTTEKKPGNAYIGLVHRLDREASGVLVLAKTSKAAARLSAQFKAGSVEKRYWAVVEAPEKASGARAERETRPRSGRGAETMTDAEHSDGDQGEWLDLLIRDLDGRDKLIESVAGSPLPPKASICRTRWRRLAATRSLWLLELAPSTGRKHQLRLQCARRGMPIFGDRRYDSTRCFHGAIALHAAAIAFEHPTRRDTVRFQAPLPPNWSQFPFRFPTSAWEAGWPAEQRHE